MKYVQILILLLSSVSLGGAEPKTETEANHGTAAGEKALQEKMDALWEKIGSHAKTGSKHAKDNRVMFELYYRRMAKALALGGGGESNQEVYALMCLPTAYGWPTYRTLKKGIKYTGLFAVRSGGDYEVLVEVYPEDSEARIVLEIDGTALGQPVKPNERVTVQLKAGVRALSIRTNDDVQIYFGKLHLDQAAK